MLITQSKMVDSYHKYIKFDQKWSKLTVSLISFDIFDQIRSIFDINRTRFNRFRRDDSIWYQDFWSKNLIKTWFQYDFKQKISQGQSNCISLAYNIEKKLCRIIICFKLFIFYRPFEIIWMMTFARRGWLDKKVTLQMYFLLNATVPI